MDKVFIEALEIECVIGIYDWERTIKQPVVLDIEMCLLAKKSTTLHRVTKIYSMPVATAQCHGYIRKHAPQAEVFVANSTAEAARDMDILRAALGDKKLNYFGKSYGTYLGTLYAQFFPDKVGRMVLDGALDPNISILEQNISQAKGFDGALDAFLAEALLEYPEIELVSMPIESNTDTVSYYGIRTVPTMIMVDDNDQVLRTSVGFTPTKVKPFLAGT